MFHVFRKNLTAAFRLAGAFRLSVSFIDGDVAQYTGPPTDRRLLPNQLQCRAEELVKALSGSFVLFDR